MIYTQALILQKHDAQQQWPVEGAIVVQDVTKLQP